MIDHGLAADRLEYTLADGLGATARLWNLEEVKEIYENIETQKNENGIDELGFKNIELAERFVNVASKLSSMYIDNKTKFSMQFLADILKKLISKKIITMENLYTLSEKEIIEKIENCDEEDISKNFKIWKNAEKINESDEKIEDRYSVSINAKIRYIVPLVKQGDKFIRINRLSKRADEDINRALNYTTKKYAYLNF